LGHPHSKKGIPNKAGSATGGMSDLGFWHRESDGDLRS
jgi:hypothetical protein